MLTGENASPRVCGLFYNAVVQNVLLFGSESWVLVPALLAWLKGFHIQCGYRIAHENRPRRSPGGSCVHLQSEDVLEKCGLFTMKSYIRKRQQIIVVYVEDRLLFVA